MDRDPEEGVGIRSYNPHKPLHKDLDKDIWSWKAPEDAFHNGDDEVPKFSAFTGLKEAMGSSILLAACQPGERAHENRGDDGQYRGSFTSSLIQAMNSSPQTTYYELIANLKLKVDSQHPCCIGL